MKLENDSVEKVLRTETIENLLMIAALSQGSIKALARQELQARRPEDDIEGLSNEFMTNLCVF